MAHQDLISWYHPGTMKRNPSGIFVYVLLESFDYEGSNIVSIHVTRDGAEQAKAKKGGDQSWVKYLIEEVELEP